jgi:hypothetical protein
VRKKDAEKQFRFREYMGRQTSIVCPWKIDSIKTQRSHPMALADTTSKSTEAGGSFADPTVATLRPFSPRLPITRSQMPTDLYAR